MDGQIKWNRYRKINYKTLKLELMYAEVNGEQLQSMRKKQE